MLINILILHMIKIQLERSDVLFQGGKQSSDRTNVAGRFAESTPNESSKSCPMSFGNGQEGIDGASQDETEHTPGLGRDVARDKM